jgi:hypothetical protein
MTPLCTVLLHSLRRNKAPLPQPCPPSSEVLVISGGRFCRQPLENQEIEWRRFADEAGQQRMGLPAVVGVVIEPVR